MPAVKTPTPPNPASAAAPEEPGQLGRVFGVGGQPFELGDQTFHYAVFTSAGVRALLETLTTPGVVPLVWADGASLGQMVAEAVILGQDSVERMLERLLRMVTVEAIPDGIAQRSQPQQIEAFVNGLFQQSGLRLLESILKNLAARQVTVQTELITKAVDELMKKSETGKSEPSTAASGSTSSTASS